MTVGSLLTAWLRNHRDRVKLLFGPYRPPPLKRRDRAFCLFRDTDVVVTSWTVARISWPRARSPEHPKGGTGLLVCEELAQCRKSDPGGTNSLKASVSQRS